MIDRHWPKWAGNGTKMLRETSAKKRETGAKFRKKAQKQKVYHLYPVYGSMRACFCKFIVPTTKNESIFAQCCSQKIGDACIWQSWIVFFALSPCPLLGHHQKNSQQRPGSRIPKGVEHWYKKNRARPGSKYLLQEVTCFAVKRKIKHLRSVLQKNHFAKCILVMLVLGCSHFGSCHFFLHEQFSPCSCATDNDRLPFPCPQHAIVGWPQWN